MDWSAIHAKTEFGLLSLPLAFCSILYGIGAGWKAKSLQKRRRRLPGFVISVGNITTGGTGKTPTTMRIAEWARDRGHHVAVLSRGYGGRHKGEVLEVSDGEVVKAGPQEAGDEPCLMAARLRGVPVMVARKRYLAGLYAHREFGSDFFLLDDGFQHTGLERDLDLVLLDAESPFGNGHLLPWGPLREPLSHLGRASAFLITRWSEGKGQEEDPTVFLDRTFPGKPIFRSAHLAKELIIQETGEKRSVDFLRGKRVFAFAGIGRPQSFRKTLKEAGADLVAFRLFRDHHRFTRDEVRDLLSAKSASGADLLVTTEKDGVRVKQLGMVSPDLAVLSVAVEILPEEGPFFELLSAALQQNRIEKR
jgi:tetraacyldisaccharide 4'-kinase